MAIIFPETLQIHKMQDGGYVVGGGRSDYDGLGNRMLFASTSVDEALDYIKKRLELAPSND